MNVNSNEVLIDDRTGSVDIARFLRGWRIPTSVVRLPFGDAAMIGSGPSGACRIGVEIKKVRDALGCMRDGRFSGHQLPGMLREFDFCWLVIEGTYGVDFATGVMTRSISGSDGKRTPLRLGKSGPGFLYKELDMWLTSLEMRGGMHVRRTTSRTETARFIADLSLWWSKPWEGHKAHLSMHQVAPDEGILAAVSTVRKIAAQLPGIGWQRSRAVEERFPTVLEMVTASESEWASVDGIGKTMARRITDAIFKPS